MTDRQFWQKFYRHAKGMADAVKELLDRKAGTPGGFIIPGPVVAELDIEKVEEIIDILVQEVEGSID